MKKSKTATTIAEAMVVTLIIVMWLTWVYNIYSQSIKLTDSVENKIQAIQIAREWIEAVTNIRDTNWLLFSSDTKNCWKTLNYNSWCIWNASPSNINWDYRVYRDASNRWILEQDLTALDNYATANYKNFYKVYLDTNWLYTHNTWTNLKQYFTRQIKTSPADPGWDNDMNNWLKINSIVRWVDSSTTAIREVNLETILTNYK